MRRARLSLVAMLLVAGAVRAGTLLEDFRRAQLHDPAYLSAMRDTDVARLQARIASMAYYPEARLSASQLDNESSSRTTLSISQPLLSYDRWLTLKEVDPRLAQVAARLEQNQQDLALRVVKAVRTLAETRERLSLNRSSQAALEVQEQSARRSFELGVGTITDLRDIELRVAQTRSQSFALQAAVAAAERQYAALTGTSPASDAYRLSGQSPEALLPPLSSLLTLAAQRSPGIRASEQAVQLAQIGVQRARASYFPSVVANMQRSQVRGGASTESAGVSLRFDLPIQVGTFFRGETAALEVERAREQVRQAQQQVALDVERLYQQVLANQSEVQVRRQAIEAAQLSLQANEQSFLGGVRTKIDVLNALQGLFQARADHAQAMLQYGENLLTLQVVCAGDLADTLRDVQRQVFVP